MTSRLGNAMVRAEVRESIPALKPQQAEQGTQAAEMVLCPGCNKNWVEPGMVCQACSDEARR